MLKVTEFAFVGYPVADMIRARAFYEGTLNLEPVSMSETDGKEWVEYEIGPHVLAISNMGADQWAPGAHGPSVALEVENFESAIEHLRSHDTRFAVEPFTCPTCQIAVILDPDGNSLTIHKRKAQ